MQNEESLIPGVSRGKYSFQEESHGLEGLTTVKKEFQNEDEMERRRYEDGYEIDENEEQEIRQIPQPKGIQPIVYESKELADTNAGYNQTFKQKSNGKKDKDFLADSLDVMRRG